MTSHAKDIGEYLKQPRTFYIGFDPTADSLHAGHLFQIINMYRLAQMGHKPICIVGGGTAVIGDPSGRSEMRKMMTPEILESNKIALQNQVQKLLKIGNVEFLNNADWLLSLKYLEFMSQYGIHFKINELIKKDIYKERLEREEGLTMFELNYICLQSYDFLHLFRNYNCTLQLGATDQWSNILGGVELIKKVEGKDAYAMVSPLLTRSDGKKMGKSEGGALWLDPNKTSPYEFYQYFINIPDADVEKFLNVFTFLEDAEIKETLEDVRNAKKVLAKEVCKFVHGEDETRKAIEQSEALFGGNKSTENMESISATKFLVEGKLDLVSFLSDSGILKSKREAKDLLSAGGIYVNDEKVLENMLSVNGEFLLRVGKKKYFKVIV
jgi:tyrosyl-tRNA synthetase